MNPNLNNTQELNLFEITSKHIIKDTFSLYLELNGFYTRVQ